MVAAGALAPIISIEANNNNGALFRIVVLIIKFFRGNLFLINVEIKLKRHQVNSFF